MVSNEKRIKDCKKTMEIINDKIIVIQRELNLGNLSKKTREEYKQKLNAAQDDLVKIRTLKRKLEKGNK